MKKVFLSIAILFIGGVMFSGCIKNQPYVTTTNPSMTASIQNYNFISQSVITATIDTQLYDSTTTLVITGTSSDHAHPYDKMQLVISRFKNKTGVYSIVQGQASAVYTHSGVVSPALGGVIAITSYTANTIIGYFNFDTDDNVFVKTGSFIANRP